MRDRLTLPADDSRRDAFLVFYILALVAAVVWARMGGAA